MTRQHSALNAITDVNNVASVNGETGSKAKSSANDGSDNNKKGVKTCEDSSNSAEINTVAATSSAGIAGMGSNSNKTKAKEESEQAKPKEVIKKDMISRYADIMASSATTTKCHSPESSSGSDSKFLLDKDEIAAKIQRLLKSQWEERLKQHDMQLSKKERSSSAEQPSDYVNHNNKLSQDDKSKDNCKSLQKNSKSILRKARLQLNKKTLLKIRQPESFQNLFDFQQENVNNKNNSNSVTPNLLSSNSSLCEAKNSLKLQKKIQKPSEFPEKRAEVWGEATEQYDIGKQ